jgi:CheY-like chemotaxis protein
MGASMTMKRRIEILMVDDSKADAIVMKELILGTGLSTNLNWVVNGEEALAYLNKVGKYSAKQKPDVIILDLNMPRMSGGEFLQMARDLIEGIEVVVSSGSPEMVQPGSEGRYKCLIKPSDNNEFDATIDTLRSILENRMNAKL